MDAAVSYDDRYAEGYRLVLNGFEVARAAALKHVLTRVIPSVEAPNVLDYGSGNGLFIPTLRGSFSDPKLHFCDISETAIKQLTERYPEFASSSGVIRDNRAPFPDASFDVIVSIEVMEHVDDLQAYMNEILRLLKPGGVFVWTTPCANAWSIEWLYSLLTRKIVQQEDGINWNWDEVGHVRRVKTSYIKKRLLSSGFSKVGFRMRSHIFSWTCTQLMKLIPKYRVHRMLERFMKLDYILFRRLPNGASMIGFAQKESALPSVP